MVLIVQRERWVVLIVQRERWVILSIHMNGGVVLKDKVNSSDGSGGWQAQHGVEIEERLGCGRKCG